MTAALGSSGKGLNFRVFGFPTRVDWTFFLVAAFFSLSATQDRALLVLWVAVLLPSILVHELGHAFAARRLGAEPNIVIHSFGGYTAYVPPREPTRQESIGVSLAGPFAGFALGIVVIVVAIASGIDIDYDNLGSRELLERGVAFAALVNLGWGLVNLLPMLPLDGGHVLEQLLPGDALARHRRAAVVSVVVAAAAALVLYFAFDLLFAALFIAYFGFQSVMLLSRTGRGSGEDVRSRAGVLLERLRSGDASAVPEIEALANEAQDAGLQHQLKTLAIDAYIGTGRPGDARRVLNQTPGDVHPSLYALVSAYEGDPSALGQLFEIFNREPHPAATRNLVMAYGLLGRAHEIAPLIASSAHATNNDVLTAASEAAMSQGHAAAAQHLVAMRR